jgi:phage shock protein PspC (stress-responsive transcriptional regulator)
MVGTGQEALNGVVPENLPAIISRPRAGAMVGGVCAGMARRWRVDPNLLRIALVVLAFFGGLGVAAYGAGLLLMPREGQTQMPVQRYLPFTRSWSTPTVIAATIGALVVIVGLTSSGGIGLGPVLIIFAIWFFGFRNHGQTRPAPPPEPTPFERAADAWRVRLAEQKTPGYEAVALPAPTEQRWTQPYTDPAADLVVRDNEPPAVLADRRRRRHFWWLALVLVGAGVLVVTILGMAGLHGGPLAYAAAVLAGLGLTLVLASRTGRPPLLLPATIIAGLVTASMMGTGAAVRLTEVGDFKRVVTTSAELPADVNVTAGDVTLDLSNLDLTADRNLAIKVNAGTVKLTLPAQVASEVTWKVGFGEFGAEGVSRDGFDLSGVNSYPATAAGAPTLNVTVDVDLGEVKVVRG